MYKSDDQSDGMKKLELERDRLAGKLHALESTRWMDVLFGALCSVLLGAIGIIGVSVYDMCTADYGIHYVDAAPPHFVESPRDLYCNQERIGDEVKDPDGSTRLWCGAFGWELWDDGSLPTCDASTRGWVAHLSGGQGHEVCTASGWQAVTW